MIHLLEVKKGQCSFSYVSSSGRLAGCTSWGAEQWGNGRTWSSHPQEGEPPSTVILRPDGASWASMSTTTCPAEPTPGPPLHGQLSWVLPTSIYLGWEISTTTMPGTRDTDWFLETILSRKCTLIGFKYIYQLLVQKCEPSFRGPVWGHSEAATRRGIGVRSAAVWPWHAHFSDSSFVPNIYDVRILIPAIRGF